MYNKRRIFALASQSPVVKWCHLQSSQNKTFSWKACTLQSKLGQKAHKLKYRQPTHLLLFWPHKSMFQFCIISINPSVLSHSKYFHSQSPIPNLLQILLHLFLPLKSQSSFPSKLQFSSLYCHYIFQLNDIANIGYWVFSKDLLSTSIIILYSLFFFICSF